MNGSGHEGMVFSSVRSLSLLTFIRVKHRVVRWDSNVFAMRSLLCCVGWSIDCLCVYFCSMIAGGCMYRFGGMYILT